MTQALRLVAARRPADHVTPLRRHAAVARSLLDEFERVLPPSSASPPSYAAIAVHGQLVEELGRVGCLLLECAASLSGVDLRGRGEGLA
jgi:hypothetical protein